MVSRLGMKEKLKIYRFPGRTTESIMKYQHHKLRTCRIRKSSIDVCLCVCLVCVWRHNTATRTASTWRAKTTERRMMPLPQDSWNLGALGEKLGWWTTLSQGRKRTGQSSRNRASLISPRKDFLLKWLAFTYTKLGPSSFRERQSPALNPCFAAEEN